MLKIIFFANGASRRKMSTMLGDGLMKSLQKTLLYTFASFLESSFLHVESSPLQIAPPAHWWTRTILASLHQSGRERSLLLPLQNKKQYIVIDDDVEPDSNRERSDLGALQTPRKRGRKLGKRRRSSGVDRLLQYRRPGKDKGGGKWSGKDEGEG